MKGLFCCLIILPVFTACSLVKSVATDTTAELINEGSDEVLYESNLEFFGKATPGNLKLIEGLWYSQKKSKELLTMLIKGYGAYGYAYEETMALDEILMEEPGIGVNRSILIYKKAIDYGKRYLALKGISTKEFEQAHFAASIKKRFNEVMDEDDYMALFYFAQALGSSINLQRSNVKILSYFSHAKNILEWVCEKKPTFERGSCQLFKAVILASTPRMMGGDQQKARVAFKNLIKDQPYNLLARLSYIQYHIIPMLEEDEFQEEMNLLKEDVQNWYRFSLGQEDFPLYEKHKEFNLFNSVAKARFQKLEKLKNKIF